MINNIPPAAPQSTLRWGCEIECFASPKDPSFMGRGRYTGLYEGVGRLIKNAGFRTSPYGILAQADYSGWSAISECLHDDGIIFPSNASHKPLELVSPILRVDCASSKEVAAVLKAVKRGFHLRVNDQCGVHVHVSQGGFPFSFQTLQNLCLLVIGFEDAIGTYHPPFRKSGYSMCVPPSKQKGLSDTSHVLQRLHIIRCCRDRESLIQLMIQTDRFVAYNFVNLDNARGTIEFRQHTGSLKAREIVAWVRFVTSLVQYAIDVSPKDLESLLEFACEPSFSILHLADAVGASDLRNAWKDHRWDFNSHEGPERARGHLVSTCAKLWERRGAYPYTSPLNLAQQVYPKPVEIKRDLLMNTGLAHIPEKQLRHADRRFLWKHFNFSADDSPLGQFGRVFRGEYDEVSKFWDKANPTKRMLPRSAFCLEPTGWTAPSVKAGSHAWKDARLQWLKDQQRGHLAAECAQQMARTDSELDELGMW